MKKKLNLSLLGMLVAMAAGVSMACGGGEKTPDSAYDAQEPSAPPSASSEWSDSNQDNSTRDNSTAEDRGYSADEISEPASGDDFQQALQLVLQDEAMRTALNLEEPGRFPLKITGSDIPSDIEVVMVGEPVEVVSPPEDPKTEAVLVFTSVTMSGNKGTFKFRYDVQGIRGTSTVVRTEGRWELKGSRISQY